MAEFLSASPSADGLFTTELGLHHEQQHQELILTDVLHGFSRNPLKPGYVGGAPPRGTPGERTFIEQAGGVFECGHSGTGFAFDNECPRHRVFVDDFAISDSLSSASEFAEFIADGGYERPDLWLSDGYATARAEGWSAPLYWERRDGEWWSFSLYGMQPVDLNAPVSHLSYYEADAFARWAGARLPTEFEWEIVARERGNDGQFVDDGVFVPKRRSEKSLLGGVWVWTKSPYAEYPGFRPLEGALGEYNGKFMVNQMVLRGGSCFSSREHLRHTYRNFFPPHARWQMTGLRLAR
jgi:ergothioneine biosynthesis protein EgtB